MRDISILWSLMERESESERGIVRTVWEDSSSSFKTNFNIWQDVDLAGSHLVWAIILDARCLNESPSEGPRGISATA